MKRVTLSLLPLLLALPLASQPSTPAPLLSFPDGVEHDFGTVVQGTLLRHAFSVRNDGKTPLKILGVELSEPGMKSRFKPEVPPGGTSAVTLEWSTDKRNGPVEAKAELRLDDPALPHATLTLKGTVVQALEIAPMPFLFVSVFKGEGAERVLTLTNHAEKPLAIARPEPKGGHLSAALATDEPGRSWRLTVRIAPETPPGRYKEAVALHTDDPSRLSVVVPVNLLVKDEIWVSFEDVSFGTIRRADLAASSGLVDLLTQSFLVKKRSGTFEIESLACEIPGLRLERTPAKGSSQDFKIDVRVVPGELRPGTLDGRIVIRTGESRFPEIVVPVRGEVR